MSQGMSSSRALLVRWIAACSIASMLGASLGYVGFAPGFPRVLVDALLVGTFQAFALARAVKPVAWIGATIAAVGLGLIAGVIVVLAVGSVLGSLENSYHDLYVTLVYGLGAVAGGLVASGVQAPALRGLHRPAAWLTGNALGAPFVVPGLVISWFAPENMTIAFPLWLIGLAGGLVYSLVSGVGLIRGTSTWST